MYICKRVLQVNMKWIGLEMFAENLKVAFEIIHFVVVKISFDGWVSMTVEAAWEIFDFVWSCGEFYGAF